MMMKCLQPKASGIQQNPCLQLETKHFVWYKLLRLQKHIAAIKSTMQTNFATLKTVSEVERPQPRTLACG